MQLGKLSFLHTKYTQTQLGVTGSYLRKTIWYVPPNGELNREKITQFKLNTGTCIWVGLQSTLLFVQKSNIEFVWQLIFIVTYKPVSFKKYCYLIPTLTVASILFKHIINTTIKNVLYSYPFNNTLCLLKMYKCFWSLVTIICSTSSGPICKSL